MNNILFVESYNIVLNNMAIGMRGLRVRPQYEGLIGAAYADGLEQIEFPNGDASFLRNGFLHHN